jgi:hypothetical protein
VGNTYIVITFWPYTREPACIMVQSWASVVKPSLCSEIIGCSVCKGDLSVIPFGIEEVERELAESCDWCMIFPGAFFWVESVSFDWFHLVLRLLNLVTSLNVYVL